jgi:hypothetical protein
VFPRSRTPEKQKRDLDFSSLGKDGWRALVQDMLILRLDYGLAGSGIYVKRETCVSDKSLETAWKIKSGLIAMYHT